MIVAALHLVDHIGGYNNCPFWWTETWARDKKDQLIEGSTTCQPMVLPPFQVKNLKGPKILVLQCFKAIAERQKIHD